MCSNRYSVLNEEKENILDQYDSRSVDDRNTMDVAMFTKKLLQSMILSIRQLDQKMCQAHVWLIH